MCPPFFRPSSRMPGHAGKAFVLSALFLLGSGGAALGQNVPPSPGSAPNPVAVPVATPGAEAETTAPSSFAPNSFAQEAVRKLADEMRKRAADFEEAAAMEESTAGAERSLEPLPQGERGGTHETALNDLLQVMFLRKGDSWFTQTVRDASPVPYEMKELQTTGPTRLVVTEEDKANGIDQRISYGFSVESYRRYDKTRGWQAWQKGKPVLLTGIIMHRQEGIWVVASSPRENFSLR